MTKARLVQVGAPQIQIQVLARTEAVTETDAAASAMEAKFGLKFDTLTVFSPDSLAALHAPGQDADLFSRVRIVSRENPAVAPMMAELTRLANADDMSIDDRSRYLELLLEIYGLMGCSPDTADEICGGPAVGIEREGRILAEKLGFLKDGCGLRPHAKRLFLSGALVVGLTGLNGGIEGARAVVIDGAIASGATQIALMEHLRASVKRFEVYTAHATVEGIRALVRYTTALDLDLDLTVGDATEGLNDHHYAIMPGDPDRLVVGDLGDTISPVE